MSEARGGRPVPIWMFVVCWLAATPILLDGLRAQSEFDTGQPIWLRVVIFAPLLALTIGLLRKRDATAG